MVTVTYVLGLRAVNWGAHLIFDSLDLQSQNINDATGLSYSERPHNY
jgi:hypothetical protein